MATGCDLKRLNGDSSDAEAYAKSILYLQLFTRVNTPFNSGRKRHLSETDATEINLDSTVKKNRVSVKVRRHLNNEEPVVESGAPVDSSPSVELLIVKFSADMNMLFGTLRKRMDKLEAGLEQRIAHKVSQLLEKRVNTEIIRIRRDMDEKFESFQESIKVDLADDLLDINSKIQSISSDRTQMEQKDVSLNIVIRDLPESTNENIESKVNGLISNGLNLRGVLFATAERKSGGKGSKAGVIVARMKSHEDKRKFMSKKNGLKLHSQYSSVFIPHDQSWADRTTSNNFRILLSSLKCNDLEIKGSCIVRKSTNVRYSSNSSQSHTARRIPCNNDNVQGVNSSQYSQGST
ncbi:hypothetical protein ACF0H5_000839 [Mactra antiquata]